MIMGAKISLCVGCEMYDSTVLLALPGTSWPPILNEIKV